MISTDVAFKEVKHKQWLLGRSSPDNDRPEIVEEEIKALLEDGWKIIFINTGNDSGKGIPVFYVFAR